MQVSGAVQGVGFRPFVYRLACELSLGGYVRNDPRGVHIRISGSPHQLAAFQRRLQTEAPPPAHIDRVVVLHQDPHAVPEPFQIMPSDAAGEPAAVVMADLATCPDCLRELLDPANRRYRYPFINCTHCGPRFSIIQGIPYDRPRTTMSGFALCPACRAEYENPADRRFHAQPNACPACGPRLAWWNASGDVLGEGEAALQAAAQALCEGRILAVKGVGGFHLMCDARNDDAVRTLRARKQREEKPLAVMVPDLESLRALCTCSEEEAALLQSAAAPIVILRRRPEPTVDPAHVAEAVAPGNPSLGVLLPYTPLHHLLMHDLGFPLVATSGNLSDEPICTDEQEALTRLRGLADFFLVHNRPIARPLDDSVARIIGGKPCVLRRARGYAPLPIPCNLPASTSLLAVGAHMKTAVTLAAGDRAVLGAHIGDLDTLEARRAFGRAITDLTTLLATQPARWACDLHPDYASSAHAREHGRDVTAVQHHHAHIASGMAEHGLDGPVLGIAWDGTGLGSDGTLWGGECLRVARGSWQRTGYVRGFALPGGDHAARRPLWSAVGALQEYFPDEMPGLAVDLLRLPASEVRSLMAVITKRIQAPRTSSVGRWFDAVAALTGVCRASHFEGQAAMMLEWSVPEALDVAPYPFALERENGLVTANLRDGLKNLVEEARAGKPAGWMAARFHHTLAEVAVAMADLQGEQQVVLSGGCFQNRCLTELCIARLRAEGFTPYWHHLVPPNDGGISLGQAWVAAYS